MLKKFTRLFVLAGLMLSLLLAAGCGGGQTATRLAGLSADSVVKTFFEAAKNNRMNEAVLYVSEASKNNPATVLKYVTGQTDALQLKNAELISVNQVIAQGDYAVVAVTFKDSAGGWQVKPVGLERVAGEWYIIDFDQIYKNAKYSILRSLLSSIK